MNVYILQIWTLDQDNEGKTALHHTINNTHTGCADLLCRASKKIVNMGDQEGHTVAHDAVITGNDKILNSLLENDCDITVKDNGGHSLIHWATGMLIFVIFQLTSCANQDFF